MESAVADLRDQIQAASQQLQLEADEAQLRQLTAERDQPDFWNDNQRAQAVSQTIAKLEAKVRPWRQLLDDAQELVELAAMDDPELQAGIQTQLDKLQTEYDRLKSQLKFSGPYDDYDAIVSLHAGAGGTDAQDWAQMLLRMYVRWAEANGLQASMIDESAGDEAGIKSATLAVQGNYAYGQLKGEHGVHRLVRLSPFNADNLRQTSFAKVEVMPRIDRPDAVAIDDKDLKIDVYRSGGHGGQSVNTTDSAVRITHLPTGIVVAIQNERSQLQNKETAMTILRSRLAQLQLEQHAASLAELKGPNEQAAWGNQIRSYVLHPYKQVKDLRSRHESSEPDKVLAGELGGFIDAYLEHTLGESG